MTFGTAPSTKTYNAKLHSTVQKLKAHAHLCYLDGISIHTLQAPLIHVMRSNYQGGDWRAKVKMRCYFTWHPEHRWWYQTFGWPDDGGVTSMTFAASGIVIGQSHIEGGRLKPRDFYVMDTYNLYHSHLRGPPRAGPHQYYIHFYPEELSCFGRQAVRPV